MPTKIDEVDKTVLNVLQDDSRTAFARIAEKLNVSEATVFTRVKKLVEKRVIKRFTALVSPDMVGKTITAFVLINADPKKAPESTGNIERNGRRVRNLRRNRRILRNS